MIYFGLAQKGNSLPGEQNKIYINNNYNNLIQQLTSRSTPRDARGKTSWRQLKSMRNQLNQFIFESMREEFDYTSGRLDVWTSIL